MSTVGYPTDPSFPDLLAWLSGFVVLGGPLGDGERILLMIEADDEHAVRRSLAADPWTPVGLLVVESAEEWTILLGHGSGSKPDT